MFVLGFGYCSLNNSGSTYKNSVTLSTAAFDNARRRLQIKKNSKSYAVNIAPNCWKLYTSKCSLLQEPQPLACHGATILALSKIILMSGIEFVLRHFRPDKAQLLYLDTDSLHIGLSQPLFSDNVAKHMKPSFDEKKYYFLDEDSAPSGMFVIESIVDYEQIFAEKFYALKMKSMTKPGEYVFDESIKCLACKGIPHRILDKQKSELDSFDPSYGYQESAICRLGPNLGVSNSVRYKTLGGLMVPSRRFFFNERNSIPFSFPVTDNDPPIEVTKDYRHYLYTGIEQKKRKLKAAGENVQFTAQSNSKKRKENEMSQPVQSLPLKKSKKMRKEHAPGILSHLMSNTKSSCDIIDTAYKSSIANTSRIDDVI